MEILNVPLALHYEFILIFPFIFPSCWATKLQVKAFILKPGVQVEQPDREGIIDADGEVLARGRGTFTSGQKTLMQYDKLQISVHQGLATLFSPLAIDQIKWPRS